ncbi:hypothetical protein H0266_05355 [Halobacillus locisalis]|uniref:Small peptidoglycan-associated lipoprotein n=1 Tax=Halobacillus locisalis TaxID=220753 RepID=A0A838CR92_9BACI|nr:hypothetical protein [Halobacillus locisalis]MBA2174329.1 hypothetical protein [Halobacillus locisalis]
MYYRISFAIIVIILLAGCLPQSKDVEVLSAAESEYELFLYTTKNQNNEANQYLTALLDWRTKSSKVERFQFKQSTARTDQIKLSEDSLPALVIKKRGKVITSIQGSNTSDQILSELERSVSF